MLMLSITVTEIDYDKALTALFPLLSGALARAQSPGVIVRLFRQLGDDGLPVARALLRRLSEETKAELTAQAMTAFAPELTESLNALLRARGLGGAVRVGGLSAERESASLRLHVHQIQPDYASLLQSDAFKALLAEHLGALAASVGKLGKMAFLLAPDALEKLLLDFICRPENRQKALAAAQRLLDGRGLGLTLGELEILRGPAAEREAPAARPFALTPPQEDALLAALAGCLRDLTCQPLDGADKREGRLRLSQRA